MTEQEHAVRRAARAAERRQRMIERGQLLELVESLPEGTAAELVDGLKTALTSGEQEQIKAALKRVGDTIHSLWGFDQPTNAIYDEVSHRYQVGLSSGTGGTRLMINDRRPYPGDLIFPNVNLDHAQNGKTLANIFEEVFGDLVENIQSDENPYYVVKLT